MPILNNSRYNTPSKNVNKASKKRLILLTLVGLTLVASLLFVLERKDLINLPFSSGDKPRSITKDGVNYDPPTKQEKTETEQHKDNLGDPQTTTPPPATTANGKKKVNLVMTSWVASPNVEVRGYVPSIIEEGGTCTLTLTQDTQQVTESKVAAADASSVTCGLITVARARLSSAGTWTAVLSYSSNTYEGVSTSNKIEVK